MNQTLERIRNAISLYTGPEYLKLTPDQIASHRTLLAALSFTFAEIVAEARAEADSREFMVEKARIEAYKTHRSNGMSQKDAEIEGKFETIETMERALSARSSARKCQLLFDSCGKVLDSLSSRLRSFENERKNSNS